MKLRFDKRTAYDRSNIMFTPKGRLLQVEYARKTVKKGSSCVGIVCSEGVLLVADKRTIDKLSIIDKIEKIFQIDEHIAGAVSGLISDGRMLIEKSQIKAQQHRVTYDSPIDVKELVGFISNIMQVYTQSGHVRPFGASIMVMGIDLRPRLYIIEPLGTYCGYFACAIGEKEEALKEILIKKYSKSLTMNQGFKLVVSSLKKVLKNEFDISKIDGYFIDKENIKFTRFTKNQLKSSI